MMNITCIPFEGDRFDLKVPLNTSRITIEAEQNSSLGFNATKTCTFVQLSETLKHDDFMFFFFEVAP